MRRFSLCLSPRKPTPTPWRHLRRLHGHYDLMLYFSSQRASTTLLLRQEPWQ